MASTRERNGRFTGLYRDSAGHQRSAGTYPTRKAALKAAQARELGVTSVQPQQEVHQGSLEAYAWPWLERHNIEPRTREVYRSALKANILPSLDEKKLARITTREITMCLRQLEAKGKSGWVVRQARTVLSALFQSAIEEGLRDDNPARGIPVKSPPKKLITVITPEQFGRLLEEIPERWRLLVETLIETGCRWGEVIELRPEDISGNVINVTRAVAELDGPVYHAKPYPKNRQHRGGHRCQLRLEGCTTIADCVHHTQGKAITGDDPRFLVASCTPCNLKIGEPGKSDRDPDHVPHTAW